MRANALMFVEQLCLSGATVYCREAGGRPGGADSAKMKLQFDAVAAMASS